MCSLCRVFIFALSNFLLTCFFFLFVATNAIENPDIYDFNTIEKRNSGSNFNTSAPNPIGSRGKKNPSSFTLTPIDAYSKLLFIELL